ncbi:MAG: LysM peptidoglycan-binding domain-containing protein [Opitutae bacterium]|nr:LysM peptidoglycan-binding domain-containing protein [Opitutae bacterium]MCD8299228.1 LysM peptidoglycan-binding domain-containing protein [Opitutae bacterium]
MKKLLCISGCVLLLCLAVIFGAVRGCGNSLVTPPTVETDDENFKQGQSLSAARRDREAMEAFFKVVNSRESAPESHLELGIINLRQGNPLDAIFHFKQYLRLSPDSPLSSQVSDQIRAAELLYLQSLPGRPFASTSSSSAIENESGKYRVENDSLRKENDLLKREIANLTKKNADLEQRLGASPPPSRPTSGTAAVARGTSTLSPTAPGRPVVPATHTVVRGDSLSSISSKYYGTQGRWRDIFNYNRDVLTSPSDLKPGMVLKMPPR